MTWVLDREDVSYVGLLLGVGGAHFGIAAASLGSGGIMPF